jgi:hypothetical protein
MESDSVKSGEAVRVTESFPSLFEQPTALSPAPESLPSHRAHTSPVSSHAEAVNLPILFRL